jgi:peptidoglycan/xylan/chitin deacetylase (PgdA/CDA1 family)
MAISVTMMFEAEGGQADAFQSGPAGTVQAMQRFPNFHNISGRSYGAKEGMPRLLDMLDRCGVSGTSFMIGQTIDRYPDLAREIVARGHEAGGRQAQHRAQFQMPKGEEREFLRSGFESYRRVLGAWPKGYNAWGLQGSVNTNDLLQELGLVYTIDDRSRDEPWIQSVNGGKDLCTIPYTQHVSDLVNLELTARGLEDYATVLKSEFNTLYAESAVRRRMMSVPLHDFVGGRPAVAPFAEAFIRWAGEHEGVWFAKRHEIAQWALGEGRPLTPRDTPFVPLQ